MIKPNPRIKQITPFTPSKKTGVANTLAAEEKKQTQITNKDPLVLKLQHDILLIKQTIKRMQTAIDSLENRINQVTRGK